MISLGFEGASHCEIPLLVKYKWGPCAPHQLPSVNIQAHQAECEVPS